MLPTLRAACVSRTNSQNKYTIFVCACLQSQWIHWIRVGQWPNRFASLVFFFLFRFSVLRLILLLLLSVLIRFDDELHESEQTRAYEKLSI